MQSAETQLVNEVSCMARKAGYLAKVLSDKGLCVTLIAAPCNLQSQYRSKLVCYLRDQLTTAPLAHNSLHISNLRILLAPHFRQGDLATPLYTDSCPPRQRQGQSPITLASTKETRNVDGSAFCASAVHKKGPKRGWERLLPECRPQKWAETWMGLKKLQVIVSMKLNLCDKMLN